MCIGMEQNIMNHAKIEKWMNDRNIVLEKDFVHALSEYAKDYKKKQVRRLA